MWTGYAMSKYFGDRYRETIDEKIERYRRRRANDPGIQLVDRVRQLEDDLGRALLFIQALAEACMAKGVLTQEEIARMVKKVDLVDGVEDGKLAPECVRPKRRRKRPASPEDHMRQLEEGEG